MLGIFETFFWGTLGVAAAIGAIIGIGILGFLAAIWLWSELG